jgi:DNA-binding MarR family transcriptional regulator
LAADSAGPHPSLEGSLELHLSRLFQTCFALQTSLDRRFLRYGVTFQEALVLLRCSNSCGMTPGRLANALARDKGKITRFVDRLEARGLVARKLNPADRRFTLVKPTKFGKRTARRLAFVLEKALEDIFSGITDEELQGAQRALPKLLRNAVALGGKVQTSSPEPSPKGKREVRQNREAPAELAPDVPSRRVSSVEAGDPEEPRTRKLSNAEMQQLFPKSS